MGKEGICYILVDGHIYEQMTDGYDVNPNIARKKSCAIIWATLYP
jgi:hypothetical protein